MEYEEVKKFRDGTVMIRVNGTVSIVDAEMNALLMKKNWPEVVVKKLQKQFPHMKIEYVEDGTPGILIESRSDASSTLCDWKETDAPEEIYDICLERIAISEFYACTEDKEYFTKNYINSNNYE